MQDDNYWTFSEALKRAAQFAKSKRQDYMVVRLHKSREPRQYMAVPSRTKIDAPFIQYAYVRG